jgi:uroporphyrinogen III methyltransferase/synthase
MSALRGKRVVNTRALHQASDFDALLTQYGAEPISYPCIAIEPPADTAQLDAALTDLITGGFDWLVLTSTNTVMSIAQRLASMQRTLNGANFKLAVIGASTAEATQAQLGLSADAMPDDYIAEALADAIKAAGAGQRVLLPESAIARPTLAKSLADAGADVQTVIAYETVRGTGGVQIVPLLREKQVDVVSFTSSSTVQYFVDRLQDEGGELSLLRGVCTVCIGPKTAQTASELGLHVSLIPETHTIDGMTAALEHYFLTVESGIL